MRSVRQKSEVSARVRTKFTRKLLAWWARAARDLPWRKTRDPYRVLVSEFMLQQTQVSRVAEYYPRFLERFPDLGRDRKSTRLNSSHSQISYAVFCLKKKKKT